MKFTKNLKTFITIFTIFSIIFSSISCEELKRRTKTKTKTKSTTQTETSANRMAKLSEPIASTFDLQTSKNFRDLAGLGYVDHTSAAEQIAEIKKGASRNKAKISSLFKILFEVQKWEHLTTKTYGEDHDKYCFTIIRNRAYKKIVISFTGTKTNEQLHHQYTGSNGIPYKAGKEYIKIMEYFLNMYNFLRADLRKVLNIAKDNSITQYVFVGHSLGGAMASIAAFDLTQENFIPKTEISPVLMTYGQPRAGNYAFANELMKNVPIVFRHVNNYDVVGSVPACYIENGRCKTEFGKLDLDKNFNSYSEVYNTLSEKEKNKYYPFHFSGLIFINGDTSVIDCMTKSEMAPEDRCKGEISLNTEFHTNYFGYSVSSIGNPIAFPYGENVTHIVRGAEPIVRHATKKKLLWAEIERMGIFREKAGGILNDIGSSLLTSTGLSHVKKLKK